MPSPRQGPGWVYVLTCPDYPGCCKIGGTARTATHRAGELVREYGNASAFVIVDCIPAHDWYAVEQATHRMLSDKRVARKLPPVNKWGGPSQFVGSELFEVTPEKASKVIRQCAMAYASPWSPVVLLRRALTPARRRQGSPWRRSRYGTNGLPLVLVLSVLVGFVMEAKPSPPAWIPAPIARTVLLLERH